MSAMATVSYLVHYDTLLQNAENIFRKCDSYFIKKLDKSLLQKASDIFLKMRLFFYQMPQLL